MRYMLLYSLLLTTLSLHAQSRRISTASKNKVQEDRHIATFTPFAGVVSYSKFNPGVGVDYEYIINPELGLGVHIPIIVGYVGPEQSDFNSNNYRHSAIYTAPGIRFHTGRRNGEADFSTGPSVLIGNLHFRPAENNSGIVRDPYNYSMLGLVADNTLNLYNRHFVFGFDVRLGALIEKQEDTRFFIHFGMHFGGKF